MATATISGTITFPVSVGGPNASLTFGAPAINPSSSSGPTLTFNEQSTNTYKIAVGAPFTVPFGSISGANILYIGSDQPISVTFDGHADSFSLAENGFILLYKADSSSLVIEAISSTANVQIMIIGD
jgi:hypothetical protein